MLAVIIKQWALEMLIKAAETGDPELIRLFWDLKYIYKYGIPLIPQSKPHGPWPPRPQPQPDPSPIDRLQLHEDLLMGLVDIQVEHSGSRSSLENVLRKSDIRLVSAKKLAKSLESTLSQLNDEIGQLEKLV